LSDTLRGRASVATAPGSMLITRPRLSFVRMQSRVPAEQHR
jgi:hypothetical protein